MSTVNDIETMNSTTPAVAAPTRARLVRRLLFEFGIYFVLIILVIVATSIYPGFLSWDNIRLVLLQNVPLGITAVGVTIVLIGGGFDLSVGAVFALGGVLSAQIATQGNVGLGILIGVIGGLACGLLNALVVTRMGINPFVATLGSGTLITGAILLYTNSQTYAVSTPGFGLIGTASIGPIPIAIVLMIVIFGAAHLIMRKTVYGRALFAVGSNKEASRLSGLRTNLIQGSTYAISGTLAGLAGVISASQLSNAQGNSGATLALDSIAVVVIGGTSLAGGEGSILRSAVGLLVLATLENIYFSLGIDTYWQLITQGIVVIGAVALDVWLRKAK